VTVPEPQYRLLGDITERLTTIAVSAWVKGKTEEAERIFAGIVTMLDGLVYIEADADVGADVEGGES
jgi:hypothetical protein